MVSPADQLTTNLLAVRTLPRPARLAALTAAFNQCTEPEHLPIAIELIELAIVPDAPSGRWTSILQSQARALADEALGLILTRWDRMPEEARTAALVVGSTRLPMIAQRIVDSISDDQAQVMPDRVTAAARRSIALLAQHARDPALLRACGSLLGDPDDQVAECAQNAMLAMAMGPGDDPDLLRPEFDPPGPMLAQSDRLDEQADRVTVEQITLAVLAFPEHRRRGVLLAALMLLARPRPPHRTDVPVGRLAALVGDETQPAGAAIKSVLRLSRSPMTRTLAWRLVGEDGLSGAARARLERSHTLYDHEVVLELGHLVLAPRRVGRLAAMPVALQTIRSDDSDEHATRSLVPGGLLPTGPEYDALSPGARMGLVRLVAALDLGTAQRAAALEPTLDDDSARVRHAAARTAPSTLQLDLAFDPQPRVAQTAALAWSKAGTGRWLAMALGPDAAGRARSIERLGRSPHRSLRAYASQEIGRLSPWRPDLPASRLIARRLLERAPEAFIEAVRLRLVSHDAGERERAIGLCLALDIAGHFESELIEATRVRSNDRAAMRAAASAASALGRVSTPSARRALMVCLSHADARVRANAVTAIARHRVPKASDSVAPQTLADPHADRSTDVMLIELMDSSHHRVRANALRALLSHTGGAPEGGLYQPSAIQGLLAMLSDDRAEHRLAGLWLAERSLQSGAWQAIEPHGSAVAVRVNELLGSDQSKAVRRRAVRCARSLSARTRSQWRRTGEISSALPTRLPADWPANPHARRPTHWEGEP